MNAAPETLPLISPLASPVEPLRDGSECTFDPEICLSAFHQSRSFDPYPTQTAANAHLQTFAWANTLSKYQGLRMDE